MELTDINALANEYIKLSYPGFRARDKNFTATMTTEFDNTIEKINIVPREIGRLLLNLYNNAFYALAQKRKSAKEEYEPTVSVKTKKLLNPVEIKIRDNGIRIPPKISDKIFQPFFTTNQQGRGLVWVYR